MDTILVIDDTLDNVKVLLNFLRNVGFKVFVAQDGRDGIEVANSVQPDLILLDVMMPGMNGFEVCEILKNHEQTKYIPIILMTISTRTIDKIKGFKLGAADYITKPFEQEEVLARITTQLKLYKLQQQLLKQNLQLQEEITRCKQIEMALQDERNSLVKRTAELSIANAKLARITKLKDEFLANMSHELRSPLNSILGISEAFLEQIYGSLNDKQLKFMRTLEGSARHLLALINDILDLSTIEAEKLTLKINTVSVNEICQASLCMTKEAAYKKKIRVSITLDYTVDKIQADERRLKQILVNLLNNAIKFTSANGLIKLEVQGDTQHNVVNFSVRDTGIGIAQEDIEHIFEPFTQGNGGLNRSQEGVGLGLSLVHQLTKMHGGKVSVESKVAQGSCFTVSLPWQPVNQNNFIPETKPLKVVSKSESVYIDNFSKKILLAEDQETTIQFMFDYLTTLGYQVITARDGIEAVKQCKDQQPDLILMDIQMPVMNGLEAIKEIRTNSDIATIPIIALTAFAMSGDQKRCLEAGANGYLSKPINMKKLIATIEEFCNNKAITK